jgi:hypothetical protein
MFFILVHSNFYGIPLPDHVLYTKRKVNKKFHGSRKMTRYYDITFREKTEEYDSTNKKNDNGELQEQELVLLL